jgi:hypothetical protein
MIYSVVQAHEKTGSWIILIVHKPAIRCTLQRHKHQQDTTPSKETFLSSEGILKSKSCEPWKSITVVMIRTPGFIVEIGKVNIPNSFRC